MRASRNDPANAPSKRAAQPSAPGGGSAVGSGSNTDAKPTQMLARARACFGLDWPAPRHAMQAGVAFLEEALWGRPPPPTSPSALLDVSSNAGGARISVNGTDASSKTGGSAAEGASNGSSSSGGGTDSGSSNAPPLLQHRRRRVVLVPDKDVDGLSAGALLLRTLNALIHEAQQQCRPGADDVEVAVVHIGKGENVFQPHVAARLAAAAPTALVLLDMGSRGGGGPLLPQLQLPLAAAAAEVAAAAAAPEQRRKDGEGMEEERQLPIDDSVGGGAVAKAVAPAAASAAAECAGGEGGGKGGREGGGGGGGGDGGGGGGCLAVPTLVIDHHKPEGFPEGAVAVSAFGCAPVATSALLTWCLCAQLHPASAAASSWLAVLGTLGDLGEEGLGVFTGAVGGGDNGGAAAAAIASATGAGQGGGQSSASAGRGGGASGGGSSSGGGGSASDGVEQQAGGATASGPAAAAGAALPELDLVFRAGRKTHFKDAVALLNAARRSPECDVAGAWAALCAAQQPADISKGDVPGAAALRAARANLKAEAPVLLLRTVPGLLARLQVDRLAATPPRFSSDGGVALLAVSSGWQVHPLLPQRWAYRLGSQDRRGRLRAVMCANRGYMPGRVHFSMRRATGPGGAGVDLICLLQDLVAQRCALAGVAGTPLSGLGGRLGADFARGHPEATGGMLAAEDFAQLMLLMGFTADLAYGAAGMTVGPEHKQLAEAAAAALQSLQQPAQGEARTLSSGGAAGTPGPRSGAKKRGGGGGSASTVAGATDSKQRKLTDFMPARPKKAAAPEQP